MSSHTLRAFIAIDLPETLRSQISRIQQDLRATGADVRWVETQNLHLTLKFIGSIEEADQEKLVAAVNGALQPFPPFVFHLEGLGVFPRLENPRVVWLGVSDGSQKLERIAAAVEKACMELGLAGPDHPFTPHLTIGRIHSNKRLEGLIYCLQRSPMRTPLLVQVRQLLLLQSTLQPQGPVYTPLAELPLGATRSP